MPMTVGLPYDAPFQDAMQFYYNADQYIQVKVQVPYSIPDGYSLRFKLTSCYMRQGTAYINFHSLSYTPRYDYSKGTRDLVVSNFGPIVVGTTFTLTFNIVIQSYTAFRI